jgi:wobble nucleotide-excising tRNase
MDYESEYHYLFSVIYRAATQSVADNTLESYYCLPNIARRLLESFLAFRYPNKRVHELGEFHDIVENTTVSQEQKTRILRFLHTHSHNGQIDEPEHDISILSETHNILKDVLELIKNEDQKHYTEMMKLLSSENTEVVP